MRTSEPEPDDGVTPVFELTKRQLRPIVESVAGECVRSFEVGIEHEVPAEHYGRRGEKLIPTFTYTAESGRTGRAVVFVKQHCNRGPNEALHYEWLTKHSAPIPRCYGTVSGPGLHDIVFLEQLDPFVGDEEQFLQDDEKTLAFLSATARFNAIRPCPECAAALPCKLEYMGIDEWGCSIDRVWQHAARGELGEDLRRLCSAGARDGLMALAGDLPESLGAMERGLSHWDHRPHNVGWRRGTGDMVIFDLEDTMLAPRFEDVADWLGLPDDLQTRCRPRGQLGQHYLAEREQYGDGPVDLKDFLSEIRVPWAAHVFRGLRWWLSYGGVLEGCDAPPDQDADQWMSRNRERLHGELASLLHRDLEERVG